MMEIKFMEMDAQIIVLQKQDGDVIPSQDQEQINAFNAYINVLVVQIKQYKDAFHAIMDLYKIKYPNKYFETVNRPLMKVSQKISGMKRCQTLV